jgi:hypothetical protein
MGLQILLLARLPSLTGIESWRIMTHFLQIWQQI